MFSSDMGSIDVEVLENYDMACINSKEPSRGRISGNRIGDRDYFVSISWDTLEEEYGLI